MVLATDLAGAAAGAGAATPAKGGTKASQLASTAVTNGVPNSARAIVTQFLNTYGLGTLANWAWKIYTSAGGGSTGIEAITAELPNTKEFQARFPAYAPLAKAGRAMTVQQMLSYETTARQIFKANGIPGGFYDTPAQLAKFMENDVSTSELETRVKDAQQAVIAAPQDVRNQLQTLYGIDHGHLTAFFLDPTKAEPIIAQKYTAAQIAAESGRAGVGQLNVGQAEGLAHLGVTDAQAAQGFGNLGTQAGLFEAQTQGEQTVGLDTELAAQFGGDAAAQLAFKQRAAARVAQFNANSGFGVGQSGVGGLGPAQGSTDV